MQPMKLTLRMEESWSRFLSLFRQDVRQCRLYSS